VFADVTASVRSFTGNSSRREARDRVFGRYGPEIGYSGGTAETSVRSSHLVILVDETAEHVPTTDRYRQTIHALGDWCWACRGGETDALRGATVDAAMELSAPTRSADRDPIGAETLSRVVGPLDEGLPSQP
jgi:hypothetical protein